MRVLTPDQQRIVLDIAPVCHQVRKRRHLLLFSPLPSEKHLQPGFSPLDYPLDLKDDLSYVVGSSHRLVGGILHHCSTNRN
jgi:hypothetical protein